MDGSQSQGAPTAVASPPVLTDSMVRNLVSNWYRSTNDHLPVEQLVPMLADDVTMTYPNVGQPFTGIPAFRSWYADVLGKYFDETHVVEKWDISIEGDHADVVVFVRWERRAWQTRAALSAYTADLSRQRFRIEREPDDGRVVIREKHAETFEPTAAVYGPRWSNSAAVADAITLARAGDVGGLQRWSAAGGNPNQYDPQGWTPLLAAAVRGQSHAVQWLVTNAFIKADLSMPHGLCGALPIHFAGQSGDVATAAVLLGVDPGQINTVWGLNGHTLFLQAVFFDHRELAAYALRHGADTAITTARGLGGMKLAAQFQNHDMMEIIRPFDAPAADKKSYYEAFLRRIAPIVPARDQATQQRSDQLVTMIADALAAAANDGDVTRAVSELCAFIDTHHIDVNRSGGPLQQPPLVVAVTGTDGDPPQPQRGTLRMELAQALLARGADPLVRERHPMGVDAIIRAAVFNHLDVLAAMGHTMTPQRLAEAINEQPAVNGLTALHDTVLRASTASPQRLAGYLQQVRWLVANGARIDIDDYSGLTQQDMAERVADPARRQVLLEALGVSA
jgi:hypothetical protein